MAIENKELELIDANGKLVQKITIYQGSTIAYFDTKKLYSGEYFIRELTKDGNSSLQNPVMTYPDTGNFGTTLIVTSFYGCLDIC